MKKGERTQIFSVFGQLEAVAAEILIQEGKAQKIEAKLIPESALFGTGPYEGQRARFAVQMPKSLVPRFNDLIADLRA